MRLAKLVMLLAVILAAVGGTAFLFGDHPYTVTAYFLSAEGLTPNNDVVMSGVTVGSVKDVRLGAESQAQGGAIIVMEIDSKYGPLHWGTHATIKQKGLLGNTFVDLTPGPASNPPMSSGSVLPLHDTSTPVDLDQVTDIFDKNTRAKIQAMTRQGGVALQGNGAEVNKLLGQLQAITANSSDITANLDSRYSQLDALTAEFDKVAYQMASEDQNFRGDISNGASILNTLAAHNRRLQDEITFGNLTLSQLNGALNGHQQDLNLLLKEMPDFLSQAQAWANTNSTALAILDPCIGDIIAAITEMRNAQYYVPSGYQRGASEPQDASGMTLRVSAVPVNEGSDPAKGTQQHPPSIACSGGRP